MRAAVLYLRSSKDRHDLSIAAQRRELELLAQAKSLPIVGEYADAVESGKDGDRAGFQRLLVDLKARGRAWSVILALDTSRIARRRYIAQALGHEAKKLGVSILYAKVPEVDPISAVILESVLQAMDEVHSLMSREKGLAGMAENVRRGFRAGGRAPMGYRLERVTTGTIRDGAPVMKSRLVPDASAPRVAAYLRARADGQHGTRAAAQVGLEVSRSTLVDVEWNALTYAGHTVWNMRRAKDQQAAGSRRPRSEWVIHRGTHEALISEAEAEAILARLEAASGARERTRHRGAGYLLSGLLVTPAGAAWHGDRGNYATAGGHIRAEELEAAVLEQLAADFARREVIAAFTREVRALQESLRDARGLVAAREALAGVEARIRRLTALLGETTEPAPLLRRLEELEGERRTAADEVARAEAALADARVVTAITEADVAQLLAGMAGSLAALPREALKDALRGWLSRVELDPVTRQGRVVYRLFLARDNVASPRRAGGIPAIFAEGPAFTVRRHRRPPTRHGART